MIHVQCQGCGAWDIAGPGHPAVRQDPGTGQHELFDRTALRHAHADGCQPDAAGNYPLAFTFLSGVQVSGVAA